MIELGQALVLRGSIGRDGGNIASPYIARAQAKTASVLWVQGFVKEEDEAFKSLVAAYEKAGAATRSSRLIPFGRRCRDRRRADQRRHARHHVPRHCRPSGRAAEQLDDKLIDVSDVVETRKDPVPSRRRCWRPATTTTSPAARLHLRAGQWACCRSTSNSMVEKAGFSSAMRPTWDTFSDFFKPMQKKLRETQRNVYVHGLQPTPTGRPSATTPSTTF